MKRAGLLLALALAAACGDPNLTEDAGVDAGTSDVGPARDEIPNRPGLAGAVYDRAGRPYVSSLLVGVTVPTATGADSARAAYNAVEPQNFTLGTPLVIGPPTSTTAARLLLPAMGAFDALDGACEAGDLVTASATLAEAYRDLTALVADDRIWVDTSTAHTRCDTLLAVERRALGLGEVPADDCGGRAPHVDTLDAMLGLLTSTTAADGVETPAAATSTVPPFFVEAP